MTKSISKKQIQETIKVNAKNALDEDHAFEDQTTKLLNKKIIGEAFIRSNQKAILCGIPWANKSFKLINKKIKINWYAKEGDLIKKKSKNMFYKRSV